MNIKTFEEFNQSGRNSINEANVPAEFMPPEYPPVGFEEGAAVAEGAYGITWTYGLDDLLKGRLKLELNFTDGGLAYWHEGDAEKAIANFDNLSKQVEDILDEYVYSDEDAFNLTSDDMRELADDIRNVRPEPNDVSVM